MTRVPLSVIGGYLGAGKTTLINYLLASNHGLKLAVLVNDFGAINIDAALLQSADKDTIELTNGCVCCTMSGDLFFAIGDLLDRDPRPDHILVEASGIADPAKIADVAFAEKELRYSGIVTVVDGLNIVQQLGDARISEQVRAQLQVADVIVLGKSTDEDVLRALERAGVHHWVSALDIDTIAATVFGNSKLPEREDFDATGHPSYVHWSDTSPLPLSKPEIDRRLAKLPDGLLRMKALLPDTSGGVWELHVVGTHTDVQKRPGGASLGIVAIGLGDALTSDSIRQWWCQGEVT